MDTNANAYSPQYASPDGTLIDMVFEHPDLGPIPFSAHADDTEALGRELYARAIAGEFGEIAAYDGPSAEELLAERVRAERNARLGALDAIASNPLRWAEYSADQQAAFATYRQALLDVPQQPGFPDDIVWPQFPDLEDSPSKPWNRSRAKSSQL